MPITLTYAIEMTPGNASKISAINAILLGTAYSKETTKTENSYKEVEAEEKPPAITITELKKAAKEAKTSFGEEFAIKVLKDLGITPADTLGRSMSAVPEDKYSEVIDTWKSGPVVDEKATAQDDELEDDEFGEDAVVDAEAVKTALKAYAKEKGRDKAKEIMEKYKTPTLSKVDDLSSSDLTKMMKELI